MGANANVSTLNANLGIESLLREGVANYARLTPDEACALARMRVRAAIYASPDVGQDLAHAELDALALSFSRLNPKDLDEAVHVLSVPSEERWTLSTRMAILEVAFLRS